MKFTKSFKYIIVTVLAISVVLIGSNINGFAATGALSDYQSQKEQLAQEMEAQRKLIYQQQQNKKTIQGQVDDLDVQIGTLEKDIQNAENQLQALNGQINQANKELKETEAKLEQRSDTLAKRVRQLYVMGDVSLMDVLFESTSYNDFLVRYDMVSMIMDQDVTLLGQIKADKASIEKNKAFLEESAADLKTLKSSKESSRNSLEKLQAEKNTMLKSAESDIATAKQYYDEMEEASAAVEAKIRAIQSARSGSSSTVVHTGAMTWPLPGHSSVSSPYGMRLHPTLNVYKMHTGVDFSAPAGTKIVAAGDGTIINASYLGGYGNTVIIDHGNGLSTLYAHMSSFAVSVGQDVSAGQKVGGVGTTGNSTGNHLHFEVRVNGKHVNPWNYI